MVQLHHKRKEIGESGGALVVLGNGTPNFIAGFRDRTGYDGPLYTDPSRKVYQALELKRSVSSTLGFRAIGRAVKALGSGFRQTRMQGDPWQLGGVFVVAPDDSVTFAYRSEFAGDKPAIADILHALSPAQTSEVA